MKKITMMLKQSKSFFVISDFICVFINVPEQTIYNGYCIKCNHCNQ